MAKHATYAFEQKRHPQSVRNNNNQYIEANRRFDTLRPIFEKAGFRVWNCYRDSGLMSFDYMDLDKAIEAATRAREMPPSKQDEYGVWVADENTQDLYDRKHDAKKKKEREEKYGSGQRTLDEFLKMRKGA